MALPTNHPTLKEQRVTITTSSIGGTPVACYLGIPFKGYISKIGCVAQGTITTADATITVAVNGTTNTALGFTVPVSGAAAGQIATAIPTSLVYVSEDDVIKFTPSGASGASIGGKFFVNVVAG